MLTYIHTYTHTYISFFWRGTTCGSNSRSSKSPSGPGGESHMNLDRGPTQRKSKTKSTLCSANGDAMNVRPPPVGSI